MSSLAHVRDIVRARMSPGAPLIVGVTGAIAAGKSTFAGQLQTALADAPDAAGVEVVCTDGFLLPNATLEARGLSMRKGFPESYDVGALRGALAAIRQGPASFPSYSHVTYDVDPALARRLEPPHVLIVEGLALHDPAAVGLDTLVYLDADEAHLEAWFCERFIGLWREAETDPASFYARFRNLDEAGARGLAQQVWRGINLPNLQDHIVKARDVADIVVRKGPAHEILEVVGAGP